MDRRRFLASTLALATVPLTASPALAALRNEDAQVSAQTLSLSSAEAAGFDPGRLAKAFQFVQSRVSSKRVPGAVLLVARNGRIAGWRAYGQIDRRGGAMRRDAIFDLESISKVVATAPSIMILIERGILHLDAPVAKYLPEFAAHNKGSITIRDMLRFTSGLDVDATFQDTSTPRATPAQVAQAWHVQLTQPTVYPTNSQVLYSDLTYRTLGHLIEKVTGMRLDKFVHKNIWEPLRLHSTYYFPNVPAQPLLSRVAGTRYSQLRHRYLRGEMADEQDWWLGGIVGCDSVFSDAYDLAVFNQMMLNGGVYGHTRILREQTVAAMTRDETPHVIAQRHDYLDGLLYSPKGYGWELSVDPRFNPGGHGFGPAAYGKSGGAGTFMWIDPRRKLMAVYLTNYGEPQPFTEQGWDQLVTDIAPDTLFDLVAAATR